MADRWLKTNCLLASAAAFWLAALSPIPQIGKGISYGLALVASVQLVQEQVLKMGGHRWEEGKQRLQQILQQGRQNEWD